jgi:hypothetical protein
MTVPPSKRLLNQVLRNNVSEIKNKIFETISIFNDFNPTPELGLCMEHQSSFLVRIHSLTKLNPGFNFYGCHHSLILGILEGVRMANISCHNHLQKNCSTSFQQPSSIDFSLQNNSAAIELRIQNSSQAAR